MFLRRLGGWIPRPWGRRKPAKPDLPSQVDYSPENSGSEWETASESLGDVGPPKHKDTEARRHPGGASETSRESQVEQLGSRRMDSLKRDKTVSSTQESGRLEGKGTTPKSGRDPVDASDSRRSGVSPQGGLSAPESEGSVEKPGRRQKLLGWLRGASGTGATAASPYLGSREESLQISTNLTLHLLELLAAALLGLCSRPLRAILDAVGLRGPLGLWLHGLLSFLAALHGLHAVLSLLTAHPLHFACLFGLLQALVLAVSLRESNGDEEASDWEGEKLEREGEKEQPGDSGKEV